MTKVSIPKIPQNLPIEIRKPLDQLRQALVTIQTQVNAPIDGRSQIKFGSVTQKEIEPDLLNDVKAVRYYIDPVDGTAIKNSTGTLTVKATKVDGSGSTILTAGRIKMFKPDGTLAGNGYTWTANAADISDSIIITLKDNVTGVEWDTITLVDVTDGGDAVIGSVDASNGLAWTRAIDSGSWVPAATTTDLTCTFYRLGASIATRVVRVTRAAGGTLTAALQSNNGEATSHSVIGSGTEALSVEFEHTDSGLNVFETVITVQGGDSGSSGSNALNIGWRMDRLDQWFSTITGAALNASQWSIITGSGGPISDQAMRVEDNLDGLNQRFSERIDIHRTRKHRVSCWARQPTGDRKNYLLVAFFDDAGDNILASGDAATGWTAKGTYFYWEINNEVFPTTWTKYSWEFGADATPQIPLDAVAMEIGGLFTATGAVGTNTQVDVQDHRVVEVASDGVFKDIKFKRSATTPSTPTGDNPSGWTDDIPAGTEAIWQSIGLKDAFGVLIGVWSTPEKIQGLIYRGPYSASLAYLVGDMVTFQERSYICVFATTGNAPSGSNAGNTWWDLLAGKGDIGGTPTAFTETIAITGTGPVNLRALADAFSPAYDGVGDATITFTIGSSITLTGNPGGGHGVDTGSWPAGATIALTLENEGTIRGGGGTGGGGGNAPLNGAPGLDGGDALYCQEDLTVDNAPSASGTIEASGGGGGGGGGRTSGGPEPFDYGGGGGGGGFPNGPAGSGGSGDSSGSAGSAGTTGGGGAGGGGASTAGDGGGGGNVNVNGSAGDAATGTGTNGGGGAAGIKGYAVRKNGHTVSVTGGTVTGTQG
jgi:hypothetical protein